MFLHNSFSHKRLEQNEPLLRRANFGFWVYRTDEISLDQLMALAATDDHAAQERVWDSAQEWQRQPHALRRALTETMVDAASDPRARFVGIETYLNAGGLLERDLFQPQHEGYLTDAAKAGPPDSRKT
jgi:ParB family chromosome partitioning protein